MKTPTHAAGRVVSISSGVHRTQVLEKRDALALQYMYLVPPIARRCRKGLPPSIDLDDLVAAGYVGLLSAAVRYRPAEFGGIPFGAFARPLIRHAIESSYRRRAYQDATCLPLEAGGDRLAAADNDVETSIDKKRTLERVKQVSLSPRERQVLDVYYSDGTPTMSRVAQILNIAEHQAWHAHMRAISTVRTELEAA